jgi:ureidoglycolate hydrolase
MGGQMDEHILEISEYNGDGYKPLIDYKSWRVAVLRWAPFLTIDQLEAMERHTQTDEVFVLLHGQASLILGGNANSVDGIYAQNLEAGKLYNVRQNAWHSVVMSQEASILIVEESNTGEANTEYCPLTEEFREEVMKLIG